MPLLKTYISSDIDEAIYKVKYDYDGRQIEFIYDTTDDYFRKKHLPSLVKNDTLFVFVVDSVSKELLTRSTSIAGIDSVWVFKSLAKNTKLYKQLDKITSIEKCEPIVKIKDKKSFVKGLVSELGIDKKHINVIVDCVGDSRSQIRNELEKFTVACKVLEDPQTSLVVDKSEQDIFVLLEKLLDRDLPGCLKVYHRLQDSLNNVQLGYLILKQILCYLHLSYGEVSQAKKVWRIPDWLIRDKQNQAIQYGSHNLYKLHALVWELLLNFRTSIKPELRIRKFIWLACRL